MLGTSTKNIIMLKKDVKINIIGAGISGLIAAKVLEEQGYYPVIIEATERVGGRVKTDIVNGYQLDRGFQVLLTAYPAVKKYLDLDSLHLQKLLPGAVIFKDNKQTAIGDPSRDLSLLFSTIFSNIGTFTDKFKILKLNQKLKNKTVSEIFSKKEQTTLNYLLSFGFSEKMIDDFFRPFFSGIFLEKDLETSSRMFEFIYKMFGEGYAAIPKEGMEAIPKQISNNLKNTSIIFNSKVIDINDSSITLDDKSVLESDYTIIATDPIDLTSSIKNCSWKSCDTIYFETESRGIKGKLIGLITEKGSLINNIFYHTSLGVAKSAGKELLSVTVVDNQKLVEKDLINKVTQELKDKCNIEDVTFIKHYKIPKALPNITNVQYDTEIPTGLSNDRVILAGDQQLNGSLNAAMLAGEKAAFEVLNRLGAN